MWSSSAWLCLLRSVPLGRYWRTSPFQFSLLPRCQGEWGSQKKTGIPVSTVNRLWAAISVPWSQVRERNSSWGRRLISGGDPVAATCSAVLLSTLISIPKRVDRSTRVATADLPSSPDDEVAFPMAGHRPVCRPRRAVRRSSPSR